MFHSILFARPKDSDTKETQEAPIFFIDLNLDQVINAITKGKQEYNLKPFFYTPLDDIDTIKYRQEITRDLEDVTLLKSINSFAEKMIVMRRYLNMANKLEFKYHKEGWFLESVVIYLDAITCLAQDLSQSDLKSRGLLGFRDYILNYVGSSEFSLLASETNERKNDLSTVKYCVIIKGLRVDVRKYESEIDYSTDVEQTFEKFKQGNVKNYKVDLL